MEKEDEVVGSGTDMMVEEEALVEVRKASYSGLSSVPTRTGRRVSVRRDGVVRALTDVVTHDRFAGGVS